jgi:hypothetical protein
LKLAVERIEAQRQLFRIKVKALNRFAVKFNGLDRAVEAIESIVK